MKGKGAPACLLDSGNDLVGAHLARIIGKGDSRPFLCKPLSNGATDTARASGDKSSLSSKWL